MVTVSVIVPIYNAADYLNRLLGSLHAQTLNGMEFILVLDCPKDDSDAIATAWAEQDTRFRVIRNTTNLHIGQTRNVGLEHATGEYVAFADDDDYMEGNMYEQLYRIAVRQSSDIVVSVPCVDKDGVHRHEQVPYSTDSHQQRELMLKSMVSSGGKEHQCSPYCNLHNNIYRRNLLYKHNIRFVKTPNITPEDLLFNIETTWFAERTDFVNHSFYYHCIRTDSSGKRQDYLDWQGRIDGIQHLYSFLQKEDTTHAYTESFYQYAQKQGMRSLLDLLYVQHNPQAFWQACRQVRTYPWSKEVFGNYAYDRSLRLRSRIVRYLTAKLLT